MFKYIKKFKVELNKSKDWIFSCNMKENTHMLLVRDARSSVTGAPIAQITYKFMKKVTANVAFITGLRPAYVPTLT